MQRHKIVRDIIDIASESDARNNYIPPIYEWLNLRKMVYPKSSDLLEPDGSCRPASVGVPGMGEI